MFNHRFFIAVSLCVIASVAALGQGNQGAEFLFQFPPPTLQSSTLIGYVATGNPLSPIYNATGPAGLATILPTADGTKFYLVGTAGTTSLQAVDATFSNLHSISLTNALGNVVTPTAATTTPDGKYLLVGGTDSSNHSSLFVVSTSTDQPISGSGVSLQLPAPPGPFNGQSAACPTCFIAVSRDSQTAYVLTNSGFGTNQVSSYSLTSYQQLGTTNSVNGYATAITLSPQGDLYLSGGNQLIVMEPATLTIKKTIQVTFNFGPLQFTPDGTTAYSINQSPVLPTGSASSLAQLNVAAGTISLWPPASNNGPGPLLSSVMVAGNNQIFALAPNTTTLYEITPNPLNGVISPVVSQVLSPFAAQNVIAAAISNELPSSHYLFLLVANGSQPYLDRIDLTTNTVSVTQGSPGLTSGLMQFASVPVQAGPAAVLQYNNPQVVANGQTSLPLIARVLNASGQPVYKLPVTFTTDTTSGILINNPTPITSADGFVQTTVSVPAGGATCTNAACNITLTAGTTQAVFTITVSGSSGGGTGGGGGGGGTGTTNQVTIVSGNGQLVQAGTGNANYPMVVQVTDVAGKPMSNVAVTFSVTSGNSGSVGYGGAQSTTDANGLAAANFSGQSLSQSLSFENNTVLAQSQYGSVSFTETVFATTNQGGQVTGFPETNLIAPGAGVIPVVAQGTPTVGAIQAQILAQSQPSIGAPIPGVGIVLLDSSGAAPPVSCKGSPVSDQTGLVSCDLIASCSSTPGIYGLTISVGGQSQYRAAVMITGGNAASQITLASGNNQSGGVGQSLAQPLVATILNGCGGVVSGAQVAWSVTGSATLKTTVSSSDSNGHVSTNLTFGSTPGPVTVKATLSGIGAVTFTLTNQIVIGGISLVSGGNQSVTTNQAFQPLVFQVLDVNKTPIPGLQVTFNVAAGSATLSSAAGTTNSSGQVSTTPTAGSTAGSVSITATAGTFIATVSTLTVTLPGPSVTASSFVNAASFAPGLAPCGLGTVTGSGIAPNVINVISGVTPFAPLPYTLGGFSMSVNGIAAPIESISNQNGVQQANFQTPCEVQPGSATVVLTVNGVNTTIQGVPVQQAQPGIFTYQGPNGKPYGAVVRVLDGSYVTPSSFARRGEMYYMFVTGLGQTNPVASTNSAGVAGLNVVPQVIVGVNNAGVGGVSAQYAVNSIGLYVVYFQIPDNAPTGADQPLAIAAIVGNTVVYGNPVFLPGVQ